MNGSRAAAGGWRAAVLGVAAAVLASCGTGAAASPKPSTRPLPIALTTPSGIHVTTTGHAASARSGNRTVPGICGIQRGPRGHQPLIYNEYCVYATPGHASSTAVAFVGSDDADVLIVVGVPDDGAQVRFESKHGAARTGTVARLRGHGLPRLGLLAVPKGALGGRIAITRPGDKSPLLTDVLRRDACRARGNNPRRCSLQLDLRPAS